VSTAKPTPPTFPTSSAKPVTVTTLKPVVTSGKPAQNVTGKF
jgi:hypothetical protein